MVASSRASAGTEGDRIVSIPFIAGQWSLRATANGTDGRPPCFNPLHCGAVVASRFPRDRGAGDVAVSIPFIAGQWSLLSDLEATADEAARFNPLHCGAVVASLDAAAGVWLWRSVSIPFIAGQWSLRAAGAARPARRAAGFNPLHCGAVVASTMEVVWIASAAPGFNPLHCGAVVASRKRRRGRLRRSVFQSPSLRGSGRFRSASSSPSATPTRFQSPSLRGSGRFSMTTRSNRSARGCFNPLHCGAVVASGRAGRPPRPPDRPFQSPSLRGSGRFSSGSSVWRPVDHLVSIPFIAGQWSLLVPA